MVLKVLIMMMMGIVYLYKKQFAYSLHGGWAESTNTLLQ